MPLVTGIQTNFTTGEVTPRLKGAIDLDKYRNALSKAENVVIYPTGGATVRGGTKYVASTKSNGEARLVAFQASTIANYIIEFGNLYARFYTDRAQLLSGGSPVEIVTPYATADLDDLSFTQSADVLYIVHPDYAPRKLSRTSSTTFSLSTISFTNPPLRDENLTSTTITSSAVSGAVTLTASSAIFNSGMVGTNFRLRDSTGTISALPWTAGETVAAGQRRQSGDAEYYTAAGGTCGTNPPSHLSGSHSDGGVTWAYVHDGAGWVTITSYTDTTHVSGSVTGGNELPYNVYSTGTKYWSEGAWSAYRGYPRTTAIFQQRLTFGGNNSQPDTLWLSRSNVFENFTPSTGTLVVQDDDALTYTLASEQVNSICWLNAGTALIIGTTGGEFSLQGAQSNTALTATSVAARKHTKYGSQKNVPSIRIGDAILYVQNGGRKLNEMQYNFSIDAYVSRDLTIMADHVAKTGITGIVEKRFPNPACIICTTDGVLSYLTYNSSEKVFAWSRLILGGGYYDNAAIVDSIATIGSPDGGEDDLWCLVRREVNGNLVRYVEYMANPFDNSLNVNEQEDAYLLDCGLSILPSTYSVRLSPSGSSGTITLTASAAVFAVGDVGKIVRLNHGLCRITAYTSSTVVTADVLVDLEDSNTALSNKWSMGAEFSSISGLSHLEGESVIIIADGVKRDAEVVTSGVVNISGNPASIIHIGLPYVGVLESLDIEAGAAAGTASGQPKRISQVWFKLMESLGAYAGVVDQSSYQIPFRTALDRFDRPSALFSGFKKVDFPASWDEEASWKITSESGLPLTVLSTTFKIKTNA